MPIETDKRLKGLLAEGRITALTLDTNVFDGQRLNLKSAPMKAVSSLKEVPFSFVLSETVVREVQGHATKLSDDAFRSVKKAIGEALFAFDTDAPTRDELLDQIAGKRSPADIAAARVMEFLKDSNCEVLNDTALVDTATVFSAYFENRPPFNNGKKAEFPDALALHALERAAKNRETGFIVVSEDGDWRVFCEKSQWLFLVPKVEKALSLINDAPLGLRNAAVSWLSDGQAGQAETALAISHYVEGLDVDAYAHPSSGEVDLHAWAPELRSIEWAEDQDIDIIETEEVEEGLFRAVVSLPIVLALRFSVELNFSIWDSYDKESVGMGGRTVELDRNEHARVNITINLQKVGEEGGEIELIEVELDLGSLYVDLGEVDVFDPEDYYE